MKTLKLGIIGAGHIFWSSHYKNLEKMEGIQLAALSDPSEESRKKAEDIGMQTYAELDDMVAKETELDALLNFSPPFVRKQAIQAAIKLDVPIFIEKPAAGSVKEAQEIMGMLKESPVPVSVGFMFRYMPPVDHFREYLKGKEIIHINSEFFCPAITKWGIADWFLKKEISGGPILDQAIHLFDLIRYLAGEVDSVLSMGANVVRKQDEACTIEDSSSTLLRFKNGVTASHLQSWVHDLYEGHITIRTETDRLTLDLVENELSGEVDGKPIHHEIPEAQKEFNDHYREVDSFLDAVRSDDFSNIRSSYSDAAQSLAVAESVNDAMASKKLTHIKEVE